MKKSFEPVYLNRKTGSIDTKAGWLRTYTAEELEKRKLTSQEAFSEDVYETFLPVTKVEYE